MKDFNYYAPTEVVFGEQSEEQVARLVKNIKELIGRDITDAEIKEMTRKCSRDYQSTCGCFKVLKAEDMEAIYKMARA